MKKTKGKTSSAKQATPTLQEKGIIRLESANHLGWQARVYQTGETKYFADAKHGGTEKAFKIARQWLRAKKAELPNQGKPVRRAPRQWALKVRRVMKEGHDSFIIQWSPTPGKYTNTSVSIEKHGFTEARRRAKAIADEIKRTYYSSEGTAVRSSAPSKRRRG